MEDTNMKQGRAEVRAGLFAAAYVKHNCNGVKAMRALGYKGKPASLAVEASKLLRTPKVAEVLANLRNEMTMGSLETLQRMSDIARGSLDYFLNRSGQIDLGRARRLGKLQLAKKVKERTTTTKDGDAITQREVELYDAQSALKTMLQFQGLLDVTLPKIKDPRDLDQILHEELLRVHGKDRGLEISKALGLKVAPGVH